MKITAEQAAAREADFPTQWEVAKKYTIVNGRLKERRRTVAHTYAIMAHRELPSEAAKLIEGDKQKVLEFAERYGRLGYSTMFKEEDRAAVRRAGEPLEWIWAHARGVGLILEGLQILKLRSDAAAKQFLERITPTIGPRTGPRVVEDVREIGMPTAVVGIREKWGPVAWPIISGPRQTTASILQDLLHENVRRVYRSPFVTSEHQIKSDFRCFSLIEGIYWQLLDAAEGGELHRCRKCRRPFIRTHGRQRFCPPRYGERESRCALQARQKKYVKKGRKK